MYIVIEKFDKEFPTIVTNEDGTPKVFDTRKLAEDEAGECQDAIVVEYN